MYFYLKTRSYLLRSLKRPQVGKVCSAWIEWDSTGPVWDCRERKLCEQSYISVGFTGPLQQPFLIQHPVPSNPSVLLRVNIILSLPCHPCSELQLDSVSSYSSIKYHLKLAENKQSEKHSGSFLSTRGTENISLIVHQPKSLINSLLCSTLGHQGSRSHMSHGSALSPALDLNILVT